MFLAPLRVRVAVPSALLAALSLTLHAAQQPAGGIEVLPVRGQVYLLAGDGANSAVQVGPQGVLVVDTMAADMSDRLLAAIERLAPGKPIRYVLNTHAHPDHTGGNAKIAEAGSQLVAGNFAGQLGAQGAQSAFIVAHENVLLALNAPKAGQPAVPFGALPTDTFFQDRKDMHFNGEAVQLWHVAGHTSGDSMVFFRSSDVIATGDLFVTTSFPQIDLAQGGHVNGLIEALNTLVDLVVSEQFTEGGTLVVPGHGRIADELDVVEYRDMVTIVRDRIQDLIKNGMTLEQVKAARPTLGYDTRYGAGASFVEALYRNLGGTR